MKRILILNGSPRKNGKVSQILRAMEKSILEGGNEAVFVDVNELSFAACKGCMVCHSKTECPLSRDDAHTVCEEIKVCNAIIVGTPIYWGNMNGKLKMLFDRTVGVMMGESAMGIPRPLHKGKKAVIVTSCTTPFPFNILAGQTTKAVAAVREILHYSGFRIAGKINLSGTKGIKEVPERVLKKSKKIARRLQP